MKRQTRSLPRTLRFAGRTTLALALAAALTPVGAEMAQPASSSHPVDISAPSGPMVAQKNGVNYVTGGIGIDSREQILPLGRDMSLQLVFAERSGAYLTDVDVRISDATGQDVLSVDQAEPLVFAELQPGTYEVKATLHGETIARRVTVPERGQRTEIFHWS
ncbi:MAG: carboxypeptidase regulatory-like domain-containing protein [Panacagrimonas sp.]